MSKYSSCPLYCWAQKPSDGAVVLIKRGEKGYWPQDGMSLAAADEQNERNGVSPAMRQSMLAGSIFGWHVPAADPKRAAYLHSDARPLDWL